MRWVEHVACMGQMRNAYKILVGKSVVNRLLGISMCRQENDIKIDHR
jgi:hypothetical protein